VLGSKVVGVEAGEAGRAGSGVEGEVGPVWFGFHIIRLFPFLICLKCFVRFLGLVSLALVRVNVSRNVYSSFIGTVYRQRVCEMWLSTQEKPRKDSVAPDRPAVKRSGIAGCAL